MSMKICRRCNEEFSPYYNSVLYCPNCLGCRRAYDKVTPEQTRVYRLRYCHLHPDRVRALTRVTKVRHNEETRASASMSYARWDSSDIAYLTQHALTSTARQIAFALGRTYIAIIYRASILEIPMMTEDKKHGRLVT